MTTLRIFSLIEPTGSSRVDASRQEFNKRSKKGSLGFDELFGLFEKPDVRLTEIAKRARKSRSAICNAYNIHFRHLFGGASANERRRTATVAKTEARLGDQQKKLFAKEAISVVTVVARDNGLEVESIFHWGGGVVTGVSMSTLLVNGHTCSVHGIANANKASQRNKRPYAHVSIARTKLSEVEWVIVHSAPEGYTTRIFIIPSNVLLENYPSQKDSKHLRFYLPVEKSTSKTVQPRVDYWQYENAWHLLK